MNDARREQLRIAYGLLGQAKAIIGKAHDEEQTARNCLPDNLQQSPRGQWLEIIIDHLQSAVDGLDEVLSDVEWAMSRPSYICRRAPRPSQQDRVRPDAHNRGTIPPDACQRAAASPSVIGGSQ